jgi:hypothetical protein
MQPVLRMSTTFHPASAAYSSSPATRAPAWQQPPNPPGPELAQRNPAGAGYLAGKVRRDEEARQHEEHVDADVGAAHRLRPQVKPEHEQHGNSAQALEFRPEARTSCCGVRQMLQTLRREGCRKVYVALPGVHRTTVGSSGIGGPTASSGASREASDAPIPEFPK